MSDPQFARLPWYPRDFASSTRGWSLTARGIYRELLDAQWDKGGSSPGFLPDHPEQLRMIAGASRNEWKVGWPVVAPKFPKVDGGRQNARMEEHRRQALEAFAKKSRAGKLGNSKRWGDRSEIAVRSHRDGGATGLRVASITSTTAKEQTDPNEEGDLPTEIGNTYGSGCTGSGHGAV
jgi:uncharacterized protein YdaU (DUF1376 family)